MPETILKGYDGKGEIYAVKQEYSFTPKSRIFEISATPEVKKLYKEQEAKFTKRKNWGKQKLKQD